MNILQLTPQFVFPPNDGGKIGIANIFKEFSKKTEVSLFALSNSKVQDEYIEAASKFGSVYIQSANTKNNLTNLAKSFFKNEPLYLFKHNSSQIRSRLSKIIEENSFDIIHADHTAMAPLAFYIREKYSIPIGLRLHNIEYKIWERYADELEIGSTKRKFIERQAKLLKNAESKLISEMDICFPITDVDKVRALEIAPESNLQVASAGINPEKWKLGKRSERQANRLVIASTWNWIHNVNGLKWFVDNVLPLVKSKINDVELYVVGKEPPNWLNNNFNVEVCGFVDDIHSIMYSSNVYIAPLFVGSGIRIKILEAMASGLPVVATSVSAEGIFAGNEDGLFVSDDSSTQASIIINLIENKAKAVELGEKANRYINKYYTWEQNVGIMIDEYEKLIR